MSNISVTIKTDKDIKDKAKRLYEALGMDLTTAVNIFFRQSIIHNGLPFEVTLDRPNAATLAALEEGEEMLKDPNAPRFSSVEELFEELNS